MTDCFALLQQPRQPWINGEELNRHFAELSARLHPDKVVASTDEERRSAIERYTELNAAFQILRDTKTRLAHWIELESGSPPQTLNTVSPESAGLFFQVGAICREVDLFLSERAKATSPLVKAGLFAKGLEWTDRIQELQQSLAGQRQVLEAELQTFNPPAPGLGTKPDASAHPELIRRIEAIYRQLSFLSRWISQLQERVVQLAA